MKLILKSAMRELTVIDCLQKETIFQMTGEMTITVDTTNSQLVVIAKDKDSVDKSISIKLSDNATYIIKDITSRDANTHKFAVKFNSNMWTSQKSENVYEKDRLISADKLKQSILQTARRSTVGEVTTSIDLPLGTIIGLINDAPTVLYRKVVKRDDTRE